MKLHFNWKLFRRFGFKSVQRDYGYCTEWYWPLIPGVYLTKTTEGPP